jgi:MFS transporter, Spinster family, sphingosine-1-phosphate transporter
MALHTLSMTPGGDDYLVGRRAAWFAFAMTFALMLVDYIDRQVIVSLFPYIKAEWGLSDKQLGALVSVVSVTVAIGALPIALVADRTSRVKSIVVMATVWSLATISCMFARNYSLLFTARALVGLGEAGYGSVGAALIASLFPARLRARLLAAFFAAGSLGSVLGVVLGGVIAARWGWQAAFGVVGVPGLLLALLYLKVRDYKTVDLTPSLTKATGSTAGTVKFVAKALVRAPTMLWVCLGGAAQLIVVSAVWAWLPSFLNRVHGIAPDKAGIQAAVVVLCGAAGSVVWGAVVDRSGARRLRNKLFTMAALCVVAAAVLAPTFAATASFGTQFALIAIGGFMMTCTVGPVSAVVTDVVHPGVRATGLSVLALFQNLFGLAAGPFVVGVLSDLYGLQTALAFAPAFGVLAAAFFLLAARSYESDVREVERIELENDRADRARPALA